MNKQFKQKKSGKAAKNHSTGQHRRQAGFIRVIGGQWRGRKLPVHDVEGLRPTTDRIKETVFNWLMQDVRDANCLDCFAGSGGLGIEALSRGAETVILVEKDALAARQIEQNLDLLNAVNGQVKKTDCLAFLQSTKTATDKPFDLVFIDPPFRQNLANPVCQLLEQKQWLSEAALIYVEVESELNDFTPPDNWQLHKEKSAGQVSFRLYQRQG